MLLAFDWMSLRARRNAAMGKNLEVRQIVLLYYEQRLTMKKISEILDVTETRVSQLYASALAYLSAKLSEWKDSRLWYQRDEVGGRF